MQRGCSSRHLSGTRNNRRLPPRKPVPYPKGPELQTAKLASTRTQIRPEAKTKKKGVQRPDKYETLTPTRDGSQPLVLFPRNAQLSSSEIQGVQKHWFSASLSQRYPSSPEPTRTPPRTDTPSRNQTPCHHTHSPNLQAIADSFNPPKETSPSLTQQSTSVGSQIDSLVVEIAVPRVFPYVEHCQLRLAFVSSPHSRTSRESVKEGITARTKCVLKNRAIIFLPEVNFAAHSSQKEGVCQRASLLSDQRFETNVVLASNSRRRTKPYV